MARSTCETQEMMIVQHVSAHARLGSVRDLYMPTINIDLDLEKGSRPFQL